MPSSKRLRSIVNYVFAALCGLFSAFFVFYTIRLLYVTKGLTAVRAGAQGTYIGAAAFPVLAVFFGLCSWRLMKSVRANKDSRQGDNV